MTDKEKIIELLKAMKDALEEGDCNCPNCRKLKENDFRDERDKIHFKTLKMFALMSIDKATNYKELLNCLEVRTAMTKLLMQEGGFDYFEKFVKERHGEPDLSKPLSDEEFAKTIFDAYDSFEKKGKN